MVHLYSLVTLNTLLLTYLLTVSLPQCVDAEGRPTLPVRLEIHHTRQHLRLLLRKHLRCVATSCDDSRRGRSWSRSLYGRRDGQEHAGTQHTDGHRQQHETDRQLRQRTFQTTNANRKFRASLGFTFNTIVALHRLINA